MQTRSLIFLSPMLAVCAAALCAPSSFAQPTVQLVHDFGVPGNQPNDGTMPVTGLEAGTLSPPTELWGTTCAGGSSGNGAVYKLQIGNLPNYAVVASFSGIGGSTRGQCPSADLLYDGKIYYGTTRYGGSSTNFGVLFGIDPTSNNYIDHHDFGGATADGSQSLGQLNINCLNKLTGTTSRGGSADLGTVFKYQGGIETPVYHFTGSPKGEAVPTTGVTDAVSNRCYGTLDKGGPCGAIYKINSNSSAVTHVYYFHGQTEGCHPRSKLYLIPGAQPVLYGTLWSGGSSSCGSFFELDPGTNTLLGLYKFQCAPNDGARPSGDLAYVNGKFYGTTEKGGLYGRGTVFEIDPITFTETGLYSLGSQPTDGATPKSGLRELPAGSGIMFGTTSQGGTYNRGTVFCVPGC